MKYYSTELDKLFDTEEELKKAEEEMLKGAEELAAIDKQLDKLDEWYAKEVKNLDDKLGAVNKQYDTKYANLQKRKEELTKANSTFHFEYKSTENGEEKEHIKADSLEEFKKILESYLK